MIKLENKTWNTLNRIWSRFIFLYLIFYIYPYGFEYIHELNTSDISIWENITICFGEYFFGWEFDKTQLLKGFDSKYDYSRFALIAILGTICTLIWIVIDSKNKVEYNSKLKILTRTILRYHVGLTLIIYGLAKILMLQFGEMDLDKLESRLGSTNGMGYLWNFMSYSKFYTISTGWIEFIGGIFLLHRKTSLLGTIILFISMINVVLIDIGYDVSVKMFAIHLLIMTFLLLTHDIKRISNFLFNKTAQPSIDETLFSTKLNKKIGYILKVALLTYFTISCFFSFKDRLQPLRENRFESLTKFHEVEMQIINGNKIPYSDGSRWNNISINGNAFRPETVKITSMDNTKSLYSFTADTILKTMNFDPINASESFNFHYKEYPGKVFIFEGSSNLGDSIWLRTKSKSLKDYPLTSNRIKWIRDLE